MHEGNRSDEHPANQHHAGQRDADAMTDAPITPATEAERPSRSLVPLRPGDAPFVNLLAIPENQPGYLAEAKREIQGSAVRRLEALERVYRDLVRQAQEIVAGARRDLALHDLPVGATKIRGQSYHLYERRDRRPPRFFSILPPADYASADPRARYLASYRLNEDSSWTRLDEGEDEPWIAGAPPDAD